MMKQTFRKLKILPVLHWLFAIVCVINLCVADAAFSQSRSRTLRPGTITWNNPLQNPTGGWKIGPPKGWYWRPASPVKVNPHYKYWLKHVQIRNKAGVKKRGDLVKPRLYYVRVYVQIMFMFDDTGNLINSYTRVSSVDDGGSVALASADSSEGAALFASSTSNTSSQSSVEYDHMPKPPYWPMDSSKFLPNPPPGTLHHGAPPGAYMDERNFMSFFMDELMKDAKSGAIAKRTLLVFKGMGLAVVDMAEGLKGNVETAIKLFKKPSLVVGAAKGLWSNTRDVFNKVRKLTADDIKKAADSAAEEYLRMAVKDPDKFAQDLCGRPAGNAWLGLGAGTLKPLKAGLEAASKAAKLQVRTTAIISRMDDVIPTRPLKMSRIGGPTGKLVKRKTVTVEFDVSRYPTKAYMYLQDQDVHGVKFWCNKAPRPEKLTKAGLGDKNFATAAQKWRAAKRAANEDDTIPQGMDIDHMRDWQLGGEHSVDNFFPLDAEENEAAGPYLYQLLKKSKANHGDDVIIKFVNIPPGWR